MRRLVIAVLLSVGLCFLATGSVLADHLGQMYNLADYEAVAGKKIAKFNEAPMLRTKVAQGELPPVEERLPENPLVVVPWEEIGKYGGTLRFFGDRPNSSNYLRHINSVHPAQLKADSGHHMLKWLGGEFMPGILESWEVSEDGTTWTLTIRKGLKWSDGAPVTSEDVRFTIEDVYSTKELTPVYPEWITWGGEKLSYETIDDSTFRVRFARPFGLFINVMSVDPHMAYSTLFSPSHYLKQFHKNYTSWDKLLPLMKEDGFEEKEGWPRWFLSLGPTGAAFPDDFHPAAYPKLFDYPVLLPWVAVSEPKPGDVIFERNPYFYEVDTEGNQLPYIDKLDLKFIEEAELVNIKIVAGETDVQFQKMIGVANYPLYKENEEEGGYKVFLTAGGNDQFGGIGINMYPKDPALRPIIQNVWFRRALSLAFDRELAFESIFLGYGDIGQAMPYPKSHQFYRQDWNDNYAEYDVDKANELLDEMGLVWDENHEYRLKWDGTRLSIPFFIYPETPVTGAIAELASNSWKDIGVEIPVKWMSGGAWWALRAENGHGFITWGMGAYVLNNGHHFGHNVDTPTYFNWYTSGGERGIEPPPAEKRIYELRDLVMSTPSEEVRYEAAAEMWRLANDYLWTIGVVNGSPKPFIYSKKLGNIAIGEQEQIPAIAIGEYAIQWYFKE